MNYLFYDFVKATAALPGLVAFRPKIIYENKAAKARIKGGALLVANHFGFFDPIYLQFAVWYRRMHFVCIQDFFDSKWGWLFKAVHCIPVNRDNIQMSTIRGITDSLKNEKIVAMFPEGHINEDPDNLGSFKSGVVLMALRSKKPIIPVYIRPPQRKTDRLMLVIGEPVDVQKICKGAGMSSIEECAKLLKEKEEGLKKLVSTEDKT